MAHLTNFLLTNWKINGKCGINVRNNMKKILFEMMKRECFYLHASESFEDMVLGESRYSSDIPSDGFISFL